MSQALLVQRQAFVYEEASALAAQKRVLRREMVQRERKARVQYTQRL